MENTNASAQAIIQAFEYATRDTPELIQEFLKEEHLEDKLMEFFKKKNNPDEFNGQKIHFEYSLGDGDIDEELSFDITNDDLELFRKWWKAYRKKFPGRHDFAYDGSWEVAFRDFDEGDIDDIINGRYNIFPCKTDSFEYEKDLKDWTEEDLKNDYWCDIGSVFSSLFNYAKHWELNGYSDDHLYECPDGSCC